MPPLPEPWLRGPIPGAHPFVAPTIAALQQAREDLTHWTEGLTPAQIWASPHGFGSLGFHLRHIAGSTGRLITYLAGGSLDNAQFASLAGEHEPAGADRAELLALVEAAFQHAETVLRALDPATFTDTRGVGRRQLPTTVIGLVVHLARHPQRHVGQVIAAAKLARLQPPM